MSMSAQIRTDSSGNITVHMTGSLDFENTLPLKKELGRLTAENPASTITIDMLSLDFVGSSGISFFIQTINNLNEKKSQIQLSNVKNEFLKVFKVLDANLMDIIVTEFEDDDTEFLSQRFAGRRRTFQN